MKNLYPGYVFIEMKMSDEAWFVVRNTPGVTGFIGSSGRGAKPFPVPTEEIEPVLKRLGLINSVCMIAIKLKIQFVSSMVRVLMVVFLILTRIQGSSDLKQCSLAAQRS